MLKQLKSLFQTAIAEASAGDEAHAAHGRQLAVAALLVEVIRADHQMSPAETAAVRTSLNQVFDLSRSELDTLLADGEVQARDATSLYEFTSTVNQSFEHDEKVELMEMLWQVAYADGNLDKHEAHLLRRLADLLHIRHREYIAAKLKAEGQAENR